MPDSQETDGQSGKSWAVEMTGPEAAAAGRAVFEKILRANVVKEIANRLEVDEDSIEQDMHLIAMGLDSLVLFSMTGLLAEWLRRDLSADILFDIESIDDLVEQMTLLEFGKST